MSDTLDPLQLKPLFPDGPTNRTDPIVRHSSPYSGGAIMKAYVPQNPNDSASGNSTAAYDSLYVDGVSAPLVKINNRVIEASNITYFKLSSVGLVPTLTISVVDEHGLIQFSDIPGYDNVISVVIIIPLEGVSKKISLDFYIISCVFGSGSVTYQGTFKCMPLEKKQTTQLKFNEPNGCQAKWCQLPSSDKPTTYKMLHCIAHDCGLGFAATQQTKEIKDYNYRLMHGENYIEIMKRHMEFSGLDENSYFDYWIDLFGYIVLANISWIMAENVKSDELASPVLGGIKANNSAEGDFTYANGGMIHRIINNYHNQPTENNLMFTNWTVITDTYTPFYKGTNNVYNFILPDGNGGTNNLNKVDIVQKEFSNDGQDGDYDFGRSEFVGFECSEDTPILKQRIKRTKFFEKFRSRIIKVQMLQPNFDLDRGKLLVMNLFEYDPEKKRKILSNYHNLGQSGVGDTNTSEDPIVQKYMDLVDSGDPILNPQMSGYYYIDGIDFEYSQTSGQLTQFLYLIKKGPLLNWNNRTTPAKVKAQA